MKFRVRTALILLGVISLLLACWGWTATYGTEHLRLKYFADARKSVELGFKRDGIKQPVDAFFEEVDMTGYFANPRAVFPFIVTVETDASFGSDYLLTGAGGARRTHIWFFGYISEPL